MRVLFEHGPAAGCIDDDKIGAIFLEGLDVPAGQFPGHGLFSVVQVQGATAGLPRGAADGAFVTLQNPHCGFMHRPE